LKAHAKTLGLAAMLGLGFSACAGDEEASEPVEAQDGVVDGEGAEGADSGASEEAAAEGVAEEGQAAPVTETDIAGESEVGGADGGLEGDSSSSSAGGDTTAPPPDVMDASTETVDAEFGDGEGDTPPPIAQDSVSEPAPAEEMVTSDASLASMPAATSDMGSAGTGGVASIAPGVVASPGAVMNLTNGPMQGSNDAAASSGNSGGNVYVVVPGDTIGRIARKVYGNAGQWKSLAEQNGLKKPYVIFPGDTLHYSGGNAVAQSTKTFTVRKGDTLSGIATKLYGSAFAWKALLTYNKDKITNPNVIPVGMKLAYVGGGNHASGGSAKKAVKAKAKAKAKTAKAAKKPKPAPVEAPVKAKKPAAVTAPDPEEAAADMAPAAEPAAVEETVKEDAAPQASEDAFPEKEAEVPAAEPAPETEEELEE
jgi:nucleoid-associated protein YgaU